MKFAARMNRGMAVRMKLSVDEVNTWLTTTKGMSFTKDVDAGNDQQRERHRNVHQDKRQKKNH